MPKESKKFESQKADRLISDERFNSLRPDLLLEKIGLKPGMNVADIGCGNGFFSVPAAELVAPEGVVFALDISEKMLNKFRERTIPSNISIRLSEENKLPVESNAVDFVLLSAVFHEVKNRHQFLLEVRRILKENGVLWILEWTPQEEKGGPPEHHRVSPEEIQGEFGKTGFRLEWSKSVGSSHYQMLSKKNSATVGRT